MDSYKKELAPAYRTSQQIVISDNDEAARALVADERISGIDDVAVDMPALEDDWNCDCEKDDREYQYASFASSEDHGWQVYMAMGGMGLIAGLFALWKFFWNKSPDIERPEDAAYVLNMLNQNMTAESKHDTLSQMSDAISGKMYARFGLLGKLMLLVDISSRLSLDGRQMPPFSQIKSDDSFSLTNTSGTFLSGSSFLNASGQEAFLHARNTNGGNVHDAIPDVYDIETMAEMARVDTLVIRDLDFLFEVEEGRIAGRKKRGIVSERQPIDDSEIEAKVRRVFSGGDFPENFLQLGQRVIKRVETAVATATPEERPVRFYVSALELVIEDLKWHVRNNEINATYHFLYARLRQLRVIEEWFSSHSTAERVERYNQRLRVDNGNVLAGRKSREEANEVDVFLRSKHAYWYEKGVRSTEKIAIHSKDGMQIFSLSEMLEQMHLDADGNQPMGKYTFLFDNSGLAYGQESGELFKAIKTDQFSQFRQEESYQHYIRQRANALFQERLVALPTPLYLNRTTLVESIRDSLDRTPLLATSSGNQDLRQAMGHLSTVQRHWNVTEVALIAYTQMELEMMDTQLVEQMEFKDLLAAGYRYFFSNDAGGESAGIASLPEILSRNTGAGNIEITRRRDVRVDYPAEFSPALKAALSEIMLRVDIFWTQARSEMAFRQLRMDLEQKMPSLTMRMHQKVGEICQLIKMKAEDCNLGSKFSFRYTLVGNKPIDKTLTLGQIMSGVLRTIDAENSMRTRQIIAFPKDDVTEEEKEQFIRVVRHSNNQDMQKEITKSLERLKDDPQAKQLFDQYVRHVTSQIPGKHVETSELASSPFLRIIRTQIPASSGRIERKSYVVSFLTGDIYPFENNFFAMNALQQNSLSIAHLAAHFVIGQRKEYDRALVAGEKMDQHYQRVIQHQQDNTDKVFASIAESYLFGTLELLSDVGPYVIEVFVRSPVLSTALTAFISTAPKVAQGFIFPEDRKRLNLIALRNFLKSIANGLVGPSSAKASSSFFKSEAAKISEDLSHRIDKSIILKMAAEKIGEKGVSYQVDRLTDLLLDLLTGELPDASLPIVPELMLIMKSGIDITGSFQLSDALLANASSPVVPTT